MRTKLSLITLVLLVFFSCGKNTDNDLSFSDPSFLLLDSSDPSGLAKDHAFMLDARGPILFDLLDLTDEQKEAIKILADSIKQEYDLIGKNWRDSGLTWEEVHAQRELVRAQIGEAIQTVLTDVQKLSLAAIEAQFETGEYPDELIEKRVENLNEKLTLNSDQQIAIAAHIDNYGSQLVVLRNNSDHEQFHDESKTIFTALADAIKAELTEDQLAIFESLIKSKKGRKPPHRR